MVSIDVERHRAALAKALALALLLIGLGWIVGALLPMGFDYELFFRPAAVQLARGGNPYEVQGFLSPFWLGATLIPLLPFSVATGRGVLLVSSVFAYIVVARKFGASFAATIGWLLSPVLLYSLWQGNLDAWALLGFLLPPQAGIWLLTMKPQIGIAPALYLLTEYVHKRDWRKIVTVFVPVTLAGALSFVVWGMWVLNYFSNPDCHCNVSPWGVIGWLSPLIGLVILGVAIRRRDISLTVWASYFIFPYTANYGALVLYLPLLRSTRATLALTAALWIITIIQAVRVL